MKTPSPERLVVLLAEDDELDLVLIRRAFHQLGNLDRLIWMPDGEHTIEYLQGKGRFANRSLWPIPTVLVLDQTMPRLTGLDVLRWVRSQPGLVRLPVIVLCGSSPVEKGEPALSARMNAACCLKGSNAQEVAESLAEAICSALRMAWLASLQKDVHDGRVPFPAASLSAEVR